MRIGISQNRGNSEQKRGKLSFPLPDYENTQLPTKSLLRIGGIAAHPTLMSRIGEYLLNYYLCIALQCQESGNSRPYYNSAIPRIGDAKPESRNLLLLLSIVSIYIYICNIYYDIMCYFAPVPRIGESI